MHRGGRRVSSEITLTERLTHLESIRHTIREDTMRSYEHAVSDLSYTVYLEKKRKTIAKKIVYYLNVPGLEEEFYVTDFKPPTPLIYSSLFTISILLPTLLLYFYVAPYVAMYEFQDEGSKYIISLLCAVIGLVTCYLSIVGIVKSILDILGIRMIDPERNNATIHERVQLMPVYFTQRVATRSA